LNEERIFTEVEDRQHQEFHFEVVSDRIYLRLYRIEFVPEKDIFV